MKTRVFTICATCLALGVDPLAAEDAKRPDGRPIIESRPPSTGATPPPASHIYQTFGERNLQLAMHYPPAWKPDDRRTAVLFFSGAHKVQPDKNGKLPPLAAERAERGLPVVNRGPGENHVPFCDAFARRGFICMRVEYRTRGKDGVLPGEDIADAMTAMRWVRSHAGLLGIDPDRVVAAGGSSGGYLAASLFAFEDRFPVAAGEAPVSARPNAIILYSPLVDWLEVGSMSESFLVVLNGDKELGAKISPARHWRKDCPPTLVMVGTEEPPFLTVKAFAEKWQAAGAAMELFVADGGKHGFFAQPAWVEKTRARTDEFLSAHGLEPEPSPPKKVAASAPTAPISLVPSRDWDTNKDAKISKAEFKAPARLFENLDTDGDGVLAGRDLVKLDSKLNLDKTGDTTWVVPPEVNYHGVEHRTYFSAAMQTKVGYNLYLPDDYPTSGKRYPVIYHLHGSGGNESAQTDLSVVYHKAIQQRKMPPVIIVFVNGGRRSYYADSADGKILAETTIIKELIPHIDGTYRTIPEKACRVLHGFSMGGFGALKLGMQHPDLFCAALSFCGGMASPESVHMTFLKHILGGNDRLLKENNPADIALRNKEALKNVTLWLFTGTRDVALDDSQWAHQFLESHHIAHRFEVSKDVGHALKRHFELFGDEIFPMLGKQFAASKTFTDQAKTEDLAAMTRQWPSLDEPARVQAVLGLLELGRAAQEAFPALVRLLVDDEAVDFAVAAQTLYAKPLQSREASRLAEALKQDTKARAAAAWQLSQMGPSANAATARDLVEALRHPDKHERNFIVVALAIAAPPAREAVPALLAVLDDEGSADTPQTNYKYPRASATLALGMFGPATREGVPTLMGILDKNGGWEYQRAAACFTLGRIGPDAREALAALRRALPDASPIVRAQATRAIEAIGSVKGGEVTAADTNTEGDVPALVQALASGRSRINPRVVEGLAALGEFAGSVRENGKKGARPPVHESITLAIGYLDSLSQPPTPGEIAREFQAGAPNDEVRRYIMALGGIQQGIAQVLLEALRQGEQDTRVIAARRLAALGPSAREAIPALRAAQADPDWLVRREAFLALRRIEELVAAPSPHGRER
jgi:acetyl esterase